MAPKNDILLDRDSFRKGTFERDRHLCVICKKSAQDAHHIMERRLWADFGYYLHNGASLCGDCHIRAEQTLLGVEEIAKAIGLNKPIMPPHLYDGDRYDKWGNPFMPNGRRMRGELFYDESVQKILAPVLDQFTKYVKYPRTYHLPWSPGLDSDDRMMKSIDVFKGRRVIVMLKMDGENTTMYDDHVHARSLDSQADFTRHWVINFHQRINYLLPSDMRLCGENLWAEHTIRYDDEVYIDGKFTPFRPFSIWKDQRCLSWDDTVFWFELLKESMRQDALDDETRGSIHMVTPPIIYDGIFDEARLRNLYVDNKYDPSKVEGYVIRIADEYSYGEFSQYCGKYVTREFKEKLANQHGHWREHGIRKNG